MKKQMTDFSKRIWLILLITALMVTAMPLSLLSGEGISYGATVGTFRYGSAIRDAKGNTYSWKKSQMAPAYWWDAKGNKVADHAATYESSTAGIEKYMIRTEGKTRTGYCIAHGIRVDTTTNLTGKQSLESWAHTGGYPKSSQDGIQYSLIYGYQPGRHLSDLINMGFSKSNYWHKNAGTYTLDDWYIATQVLIWEYQQLIRTDSMKGGHGRQENGLVSANHYYSIISGRAASDIYHFMAACIKKHWQVASFAKDNKSAAENTKGWLMKKDPATGYYTCTLKEANKIDVEIKASGTSSKNWEVKKSGNTYTFIYKGKNLSEDGAVFKFAKRIPIEESYDGSKMLIWSWSSSGSLRQAIATGVPEHSVPMYLKFRTGGIEELPKEGEPEPDYWPVFEFPVHKDDKNPGWDGDKCTPMGDAVLSSTFVLYRNGKEVDRVTLDEYGSTEILSDQPWTSPADLTKTRSGSYFHTETDNDGNEITHCSVTPIQLEWQNTQNVEYEVVEIPATARLSETASGTGTNNRKYEVSYHGISKDSRTCVTQDPKWSDIQYKINYKTTLGTNAGDGTAQGVQEDLDDQLTLNEETWINDNWRGKLLIKKQKESEDVFDEEGNAGSLNLSTKSKWRMYLNSGGFEDHPYLRFVEDGYTEDGAKKYKVVRDTSGMNNATTDMVVSDTGSLFILDIPYGAYTVEEVAADDESFVLERFQVSIAEDSRQYTKSITNKKKENVIKVVKTDAETGKTVNMKGTKFYIRYMGNHLLPDPTKSENYGRLLPNASDINSTSKDYTFTCNAYGEIVLPYDLKFGTYRLEEFLLPDGYFVGTYDCNGNGTNADYGESGEYGKDDDGKADSNMNWETIKDDDPANDMIAVYDKDGNKVEYKAGDIFNFYTFKVEKQEGHPDGDEYVKYYKAVAMKNNPVKGKIEIEKEGEILAGFEKTQKDGYTVWTPKYVWSKLKDAVFGIYAAIDQWLSDGNDGCQVFDTETDKKIKILTDKKTHSGTNGKGEIYEEGTFHHESGAKLYYKLGREASADNRYTRVYTTPEQRPASYSCNFEKTEDGLKYRYDLNVQMKYNAGGTNYTDITVSKVTSVLNGYRVNIPTTEATAVVGGKAYKPAINVGDDDGNVFDIFKSADIYESTGEKVYDSDGKLIVDLGDIGATRYIVKDYEFYKLTAEDVKMIEKIIEEGIDNNGDGKYDGDGEKPPVTVTKTAFEWDNNVTLVNPGKGGRAIEKTKEGTYRVLTDNYDWTASDEEGIPAAQYTVPNGWIEVPYIPNIEVDEGVATVKNPHYAIIAKVEDQAVIYQVLLQDKTWQECTADGNFQKMVVEEYKASYTQQADNESGFTFELDGITISSQGHRNGKAITAIYNPFDAKPVVELGIGYSQKAEGSTTTFTAQEPCAPIYFMTEDGVKTEMNYFGTTTKTLLTIPMKAVEGNYETIIPSIVFTRTGEVIDWYSQLSPDNPVYKREAAYHNTVTATRHEGDKNSEVYYTVEIVSDQSMADGDGPFEITYADGYQAKIYKAESDQGNDLGIMLLDGIYKTSTAALSDLIETITTGEDGKAVSSALPLGKYIIRELSAPNGYIADTEHSWEVNLQYKDQYTPLVWDSIKARNDYVNVELDLSKVFETGHDTKQYLPGGGAVFGIYNAAPIHYGNTALQQDSLIDILSVNDSGKAHSLTKIPAGVYYLKELKTKDGYLLNDTPYYFVAGDRVKSKPLEISKDADGKDADGMTAKAVMDGYGRGTITIETLTQYPAASMIINGRTYSMDQEAEGPYTTVKAHKDMTRTKVIVTEENPAEITLANGKNLTLQIKGNTYSYSYDGTNGVYIPEVTDTGYYADYTLADDQVDLENPANKTLVLTGAEGTSAITVTTVYEKDRYKEPFNGYVNVSMTTGTLMNGTMGKDVIDVDSLSGPIKLEEGKTLVLQAEDGATYIVKTVKNNGVKCSVHNTLATVLTADNGPKLTIDGAAIYEGFHIAKNITTARQDSSAKTVQVKINTTDNINADGIQNEAGEKPNVPEIPMPERPSIKTSALDSETKAHIARADDRVTIVDTVTYNNLEPKKVYTLRGSLIDKSSGKVMKLDGEEIRAEKVFIPEEASGVIDLAFTFDGSSLAGKEIVIFEKLYQENEEVAKHTDIEDAHQTILFPQIKTTAKDRDTKDHISRAVTERTIIDTVQYSNLIAGETYSITGTLVNQATGKAVKLRGKAVSETKNFTAEKSDGCIELAFSFDATLLSGTTIVAFESLKYDGVEVAAHKAIDDPEQTVYVPEIKTSASHTVDGTITDIVKYSNLLPERTYTVSGILMDQATGRPVISDGKAITAEKTFVPKMSGGNVELSFQYDEKELYGKTVVVFETLKLNDSIVGVHQDLHDKGQTVEIDSPKEIKKIKIDRPKTGDETDLRIVGIFILAILLLTFLMAKRKNYK